MSAKAKHEKRGSGMKAALTGAAVGIAAIAVLCAVFSVLISKEKLPEDMMKQLLVAACFISGMLAALAAGQINKARMLPVGLAAAGVICVLTWIAGMCCGREEVLNRGVLILSSAIFCGGITGGTISSARLRRN